MTVLATDCVTTTACDDCPRQRVYTAERVPEGVLVTVLAGCADCDGSTLIVPR